MKISPVYSYNAQIKSRSISYGGEPHPLGVTKLDPLGEDGCEYENAVHKQKPSNFNKSEDSFEKTTSRSRKTSPLAYRSALVGTIAGLVIGGAFMAYKNDVIGSIRNNGYQNDLAKDPEKTAREFLDDLVISNETPSEKTDEITVIQNIGDENFVEIEKLKKDKTTVRYKIEMPEGVDGSVDYEKIENTSLKDLIEQNKVSQAAIDINSDGNEEISFSFENGDVNNTTVEFDTDSDGILDKKVTIQIVDYKK